MVIARVVQHDVDRAGSRRPNLQRVEQLDHRRAADLLRLTAHHLAVKPTQRDVNVNVDATVIAFQLPRRVPRLIQPNAG